MGQITIDEDKLVKAPPLLNATGVEIVGELGKVVMAIEASSGKKITEVDDWTEMRDLVEEGAAETSFPVGTIMHEDWNDTRTGNTNTWDLHPRVVSHVAAPVKARGTVRAMTMQMDYAFNDGMQYDAPEAFYAVPSGGLTAGTYNVTAAVACGKLVANTSYQFTLTQALSEGAQLCFKELCYNVVPSHVCSYATKGSATVLETVDCTVGTGGTNLGSMTTNTITSDQTVNHIHRVVYGSNRWATSALRQWLNSAAAAGSWWTAQTKWDRPCDYATTKAGFLAGFASDIVDNMAYSEIKTALPYCDGGTASGTECDTTYDRVFLPSCEELYWACTSFGIPYGLEGNAWDWYKEVYPYSSPASAWTVHKEYISTYLGAETSACGVFERSASRYDGSVAYCYADGNVGNNCACYAYRCRAAWRIA